jgi:hypothetical protein
MKSIKAFARLFPAIVLTCAVIPAQADVVFTQQDNEISASDVCVSGSGTCVSANSATGVGTYADSVRYLQASTVESSSITDGTVNVLERTVTQSPGSSGYASFSLQFAVIDAPTQFSILTSSSDLPGGGDSSVLLTGPSGFSETESYQGSDQSGLAYYRLSTSGVLPVGTYTLTAVEHAGSQTTLADSDVNVALTVVPIPDSLVLLLSGALLLVVVCVRQSRWRGPTC